MAWLSASTLMQQLPTSRIRGQVRDDRPGLIMISGGSSEIAENDGPVSYPVTIVRPEQKVPSARR